MFLPIFTDCVVKTRFADTASNSTRGESQAGKNLVQDDTSTCALYANHMKQLERFLQMYLRTMHLGAAKWVFQCTVMQTYITVFLQKFLSKRPVQRFEVTDHSKQAQFIEQQISSLQIIAIDASK